MTKKVITWALSIMICLSIIGNVYLYNKYEVLKLAEKNAFDNTISNLESDFLSLDYFFERILESDKTEDERMLDLIKSLEYSRMISVRLNIFNENQSSIKDSFISLMDYYYYAFDGIIYDYTNNSISTEELLNEVRIWKTDMDNLSPIICSTEIRDMDRNEFKERVLPKVKYKQVLDRIKLQY